MHGALAGDDHDPLPLLVVEPVGQVDRNVEAGALAGFRRAFEADFDLEAGDVPALAVGVEGDGDRRAGRRATRRGAGSARGPCRCRRRSAARRRRPRGRRSRREWTSPSRRRAVARISHSPPSPTLVAPRTGRGRRHRCNAPSRKRGRRRGSGRRRPATAGAPRRRTAPVTRRSARRRIARARSREAESSVPPGITNFGGSSTRSM